MIPHTVDEKLNGNTIPSYRLPTNVEYESLAALYIGPKAENMDAVKELFNIILDKQKEGRLQCYPEDEAFISSKTMKSEAYFSTSNRLRTSLVEMTDLLNKSTPFYSPRYIGHMNSDLPLPGILGYLSTMLHNPNNLAFEASPITTAMEIQVGNDLCELLGYSVVDSLDKPTAWGHITCDGTIANLEAILAARNLKFYPLALRDAMAEGGPLAFIADSFFIETTAKQRRKKLFKDLDSWELLNLTVPLVNSLAERLYEQYSISPTFLEGALNPYIIRTVSKDAIERKWGLNTTPQILIARTMHYSWSKGASITGIGSENVIGIPIDNNARIDIELLRNSLLECVKRKQAVYMVVAIIGTTETGAVDSLSEIVALRDEMQDLGLSFVIHADAAWGGYFASISRPDPSSSPNGISIQNENSHNYITIPRTGLRKETQIQLDCLRDADSITIDPHKSGQIPYPAGGLCYRDGRQRFFLTWTAPVLQQGLNGESIGIYGIEGSKAGASAGAVFFAHKVIGLHENGYGVLLSQAAFNSRRFAAHWSSISTETTNFIVVPFNMLPIERKSNTRPEDIENQKEFIRRRILGKTDEEIAQDAEAMSLFLELGSELNVNAFACNFRNADGKINTDVELANRLNWRLHERLCITTPEKGAHNIPLFIAATKFSQNNYLHCATNFKKRLGVFGDQDMFILRSTVMLPLKDVNRFIDAIVNDFKNVLEEEVEVVRAQVTPQPVIHNFIVQGLKMGKNHKAYFVYQPSLYIASGQNQLIFTGEISSDDSELIDFQSYDIDSTIILRNKLPKLLDELLGDNRVEGSISYNKNGVTITKDVIVSNIKIIKKRILKTNYFNPTYPKIMPFYLYGVSEQTHIDHILLCAPNIQLTAGNVKLTLSNFQTLSNEDLEEGLIALAENIYENTMQPFPKKELLPRTTNFFFNPGEELVVSIYKDPYPSMYDGPIDLMKLTKLERVGQGVILLQNDIFIDSDRINANYTYEPTLP